MLLRAAGRAGRQHLDDADRFGRRGGPGGRGPGCRGRARRVRSSVARRVVGRPGRSGAGRSARRPRPTRTCTARRRAEVEAPATGLETVADVRRRSGDARRDLAGRRVHAGVVEVAGLPVVEADRGEDTRSRRATAGRTGPWRGRRRRPPPARRCGAGSDGCGRRPRYRGRGPRRPSGAGAAR